MAATATTTSVTTPTQTPISTSTATATSTGTLPSTATVTNTPPLTATSTSTGTPAATPSGTETASPTVTPMQSGNRFVDKGDGTITDTQTGLIWEKKDQGGGLHDVNTGYRWAGVCSDDGADCQPDAAAASTCNAATGGAIGCAQCAGTDTCNTGGGATIWDWLNQLNAASFAGRSDWRIPSVARDGGTAQLETITSVSGCGVGGPCVPPEFDTGCMAVCTVTSCSCTQDGFYWSATTFADAPDAAWYVYFNDGGGVDDFNKIYDLSVRAVRSGL